MKQTLKRHKQLFSMAKRLTAPYFWCVDRRDQRRSQRWLTNQERTWTEKHVTSTIVFSLLVPTYNTPAEYLREMVQSVVDQTYPHWQLILVDDCSPDETMSQRLDEMMQLDERITVVRLTENRQISGATNEALCHATGEFITLLDHDDVLHERALESVVEAISRHPDANLIYTDEAKITDDGVIYQPFIKPDWNHDLLRSVNYITHMTTIRRSVMERIGGERSQYDGAQDWDLFIRATSAIDPSTIIHIPRVLYYWRTHQASTAGSLGAKPYVIKAQNGLLKDDIIQHKQPARVSQDPIYHGQWRVAYTPVSRPSICQLTINNGVVTIPEISEPYTLLADHPATVSEEVLAALAAEANRQGIGLVVPRITNQRTVIDNLRSILPTSAVMLIHQLSRRAIAKHIYLTTRYNIGECQAPIALIQTEILRRIATPGETVSVRDISKRAVQAGYLHVYNPHIMV